MLSPILTPAFQLVGAAIALFALILFLLNLQRTKNAKAAISALQESAKDIANAAKQEIDEASGKTDENG
jgi:uncharacterized membrane protein YccC